MTSASGHNDKSADRLEAFLFAGVADLCQLVKLPDLHQFCPGFQPYSQASRAAVNCAPPVVARLAIYLLLASRGLQPKHKALYPHRDRLRDLLQRVYRKALKAAPDSGPTNLHELQPGVRTLATFLHRNVAAFEDTQIGLKAFGVTSVQKSLAILTEKLAMTFAREIARNPAKVPVELVGVSMMASANSPGVIEKLGEAHTVTGLMKLGACAGLASTRVSKVSARNAGLNQLRKFLKRADKLLDG